VAPTAPAVNHLLFADDSRGGHKKPEPKTETEKTGTETELTETELTETNPG
jgi:hypothetical protein